MLGAVEGRVGESAVSVVVQAVAVATDNTATARAALLRESGTNRGFTLTSRSGDIGDGISLPPDLALTARRVRTRIDARMDASLDNHPNGVHNR